MSRVSLVENFTVKPAEVAYEDLPDGVIARVRYPICNVGQKNRNKRKYCLDVWEKVMEDEELQERIRNRCCWGHSEHPENGSKTEFISHIVTGYEISPDKKTVHCTAEVLDTPYGRIVETLLRARCGLGMSTRAEGEVESCVFEDGTKGSKVKADGFKMDTVDFTADPSTYGALPQKVVLRVVGTVKEALDRNELKPDEAKHLLESVQLTEAKTLLERITGNKGHTGCSVRLSERDCAACKGGSIVHDRFERMSKPELRSAWECFIRSPDSMSGSDSFLFLRALTRKGVLTESEAFVELSEARKKTVATKVTLTESRLGDTLEDRARKEFPQAGSVDSSVYLLTDGSGIAFDGDHRDINVVFNGSVPKGYYNSPGSGSGKMLAFMGETGAMRVRMSSDGVLNLSFIETPTREQVRAVSSTHASTVNVDKFSKMYETLKSERFSMPDEKYALQSFLSSGGESRGEDVYESAKMAVKSAFDRELAGAAQIIEFSKRRLSFYEKGHKLLKERNAALQARAREVEAKLSEQVAALKAAHVAKLNEAREAAKAEGSALEKDVSVLSETVENLTTKIQQLEEAHKKELQQVSESARNEVVRKYVEFNVSSGLRLTESQRALLSGCTSTTQVDELVREFRKAIRESVPHLATTGVARVEPPTHVETAVARVMAGM